VRRVGEVAVGIPSAQQSPRERDLSRADQCSVLPELELNGLRAVLIEIYGDESGASLAVDMRTSKASVSFFNL
jgi:hypothetical protein